MSNLPDKEFKVLDHEDGSLDSGEEWIDTVRTVLENMKEPNRKQ